MAMWARNCWRIWLIIKWIIAWWWIQKIRIAWWIQNVITIIRIWAEIVFFVIFVFRTFRRRSNIFMTNICIIWKWTQWIIIFFNMSIMVMTSIITMSFIFAVFVIRRFWLKIGMTITNVIWTSFWFYWNCICIKRNASFFRASVIIIVSFSIVTMTVIITIFKIMMIIWFAAASF